MSPIEPMLAAGETDIPRWLLYVLFLPALLLAPLAFKKVLPLWRTGMPMFDPFRAPAWWPFGLVLWRGYIRISIPLALLLGPICVSLVAFLLTPDDHPLIVPVASLAFLTLGAAFYVQLAVGVFNRSRFLVPPPYRRWPGAWQEWFGGKRFEEVEPQLEEWERPWKLPPPLPSKRLSR